MPTRPINSEGFAPRCVSSRATAIIWSVLPETVASIREEISVFIPTDGISVTTSTIVILEWLARYPVYLSIPRQAICKLVISTIQRAWLRAHQDQRPLQWVRYCGVCPLET